MRIPKSVAICLILAMIGSILCGCVAIGEKENPFQVKDLTWALGAPLPSAEDFFDALPEGCSVAFADDEPFGNLTLGENEIKITCKPEKGRKQTVTATLLLINDTVGPVIGGIKDLIAYVGEGVSYRSGITLTDNCGGEIQLRVDSVSVNTAVEGVYPVIYSATDLAGNVTTVIVNVHVYAQKITEEMLFAALEPYVAELNLLNMPKDAQARTVWRFVHTDAKIVYVDTSDKASWVREAYFALQNRKGDCFSYFALSKAFFERLGIQNLDIQRLPGYTEDTHYWSMINIGSENSPQWYHYDATRLKDIPYDGSLLTDAQISALDRIRPNFYLYDRTQYPISSTVVLTPRPDLGIE